MDSDYWRLRFELLGEAFTHQMLKASSIDENSDDEKVQWAMEMKEIGNNFYRRKDFESAALVYETIADAIVPDIPNDNERSAKFFKLIISCYLNLAACYLRFDDFSRVVSLCTHIVLMDNMSVKGYFRRAQAYEMMGELEAALLDYERAHKLEPQDKVIAAELKKLQEKLLKMAKVGAKKQVNAGKKDKGEKKNMERDLSFDPLGIQPRELSEASAMEIEYPLLGSQSEQLVESETDVICGEDHQTVDIGGEVEAAAELNCVTELKSTCDEDKCCDKVGSQNSHTGSNQRDSSESNQRPTIPYYTFVKTKRPDSKLRLPTSIMNQLSKGKSMMFYHPSSCSLMTVSVIKPKTSILTETPYDVKLREAIVSTNSMKVEEILQDVASHESPNPINETKETDDKYLKTAPTSPAQDHDIHTVKRLKREAPAQQHYVSTSSPQSVFAFTSSKRRSLCNLVRRKLHPSSGRRRIKIVKGTFKEGKPQLTQVIVPCRLSLGIKRKASRLVSDVPSRKKMRPLVIGLSYNNNVSYTSSSDKGGLGNDPGSRSSLQASPRPLVM